MLLLTLFNFLSLLYLNLLNFSVHKVITSVTCMTWRSSHGWRTTTWRYRRLRKLLFSGTVIAVVIYSSTCTSGFPRIMCTTWISKIIIIAHGIWAFTVCCEGHSVIWSTLSGSSDVATQLKLKRRLFQTFLKNAIWKWMMWCVSSEMCWSNCLKWRNQEAPPPQEGGSAAPPLWNSSQSSTTDCVLLPSTLLLDRERTTWIST